MYYQEKLRLAKEALNSSSYDKRTIEYIFPELKENKDESIRNFLISKMKAVGNVWKEYSSKDIIAWLEKQGEQKPMQDVDEQIETIATHLDNCGNTAMAEILRSCNLRPQKPNWSEEDEKYYQGCIHVMNIVLNAKPYPYYNDYLWLKSLKERIKGE